MRDQLSFNFSQPVEESLPPSPSADIALGAYHNSQSLRDSLWTFCGKGLLAWADVHDVLRQGDMPKPLPVPLDFYPLSVLLNKGIVLGVESEMIQRRDVNFTVLKYAIRVSGPWCFAYSPLFRLTNTPDAPFPPIFPSALPYESRHVRSVLTLSTLLSPLLLCACSGDPTAPCSRRRSRPEAHEITWRAYSIAAFCHIVPPGVTAHERVSRHCCAVHSKDRAPIVAHAIHIPTTAQRPVRTGIEAQLVEDGGWLSPCPSSVRRRRRRRPGSKGRRLGRTLDRSGVAKGRLGTVRRAR